jgi:hypothetical protein
LEDLIRALYVVRTMVTFRAVVLGALSLVVACSKPAPTNHSGTGAAAAAPATSAPAPHAECLACATAADCTVLLAGCVFELSSTREQCVKTIGAATVEHDTRVDCEVGAAEALRGATLTCVDQRCVLNRPATPGGELPPHVDLLAKP